MKYNTWFYLSFSGTEIILLALSIWLQLGVRHRNDVGLSLPCQFESDTKRICCLLKVAKTRIILPFCDQRIESTFINFFSEKHCSYKLPSLAFSVSFWISHKCESTYFGSLCERFCLELGEGGWAGNASSIHFKNRVWWKNTPKTYFWYSLFSWPLEICTKC